MSGEDVSANRSDNLMGKTLGQFEIIEEIGRGGMATVYKARQQSINRLVALKVLPPSLLHDPGFYERFTREVEVIAELEHPHIVPIIDYGESDGIPFIAMRYLAGGSLAALIRRAVPTPQQIEKPLTQLLQALDYAHFRGIIHRDLKPGNVLLDEHNNAYLTDFGIARVLNSSLTGSAIIGTPAYMSPEQANGFPLDARSDIYAVGIVLFELLTGQEPFSADTPMALMLKHINQPLPSIREIRPEIPEPIEAVIVRATAKNPDDRYSSAGDVARAFSEALRIAPFVGGTGDHPTVPPNTPHRLTPPPVTPRSSTQPMLDDRTLTPTSPLYPAAAAPAPNPAASPLGDAYPTARGMVVDTGAAAAPPKRRDRRVMIGAVSAAVVVIAGVLIYSQANAPLCCALPPTPPFPNAQAVAQTPFYLYIPQGWQSAAHADDERRVSLWQDGSDAFISLAWVENADIMSAASYDYAIERYQRRYYAVQDWLTPLDTFDSEADWRRQTYQLIGGSDDGQFPPGQLDVFYLRRDPYLVVAETYTAYSTGDDYVATMQAILDSLRITPAT